MRRWWGTEICTKKKSYTQKSWEGNEWLTVMKCTRGRQGNLLPSPAEDAKQEWQAAPCAAHTQCWGWGAPAAPAALSLGNLSQDTWLALSSAALLSCKVNALWSQILFQSHILQIQWGFCFWLRATVNLNSKPKVTACPQPLTAHECLEEHRVGGKAHS